MIRFCWLNSYKNTLLEQKKCWNMKKVLTKNSDYNNIKVFCTFNATLWFISISYVQLGPEMSNIFYLIEVIDYIKLCGQKRVCKKKLV